MVDDPSLDQIDEAKDDKPQDDASDESVQGEEYRTETGMDEEEPEGMTLLAHLGELRGRMVRIAIAVIIGFLSCYAFAEEIFHILMQPLLEVINFQPPAEGVEQVLASIQGTLSTMSVEELLTAITPHFGKLTVQQLVDVLSPHGQTMSFFSPAEAFFTYLKAALIAGIFATTPYTFYQIWSFVAPGLYDSERKYLIPIAFFSGVFFTGGACFGYFVVFPFAFEFFASFQTEYITFTPRINECFAFTTKLLFAFGIIFELPLFSFFLARIGLVNHKMMRRFQKYAFLCSFIVSAILTPPDVVSQLLMAGPLIILYEISIWVAYLFGKRPSQEESDEEDEDSAPQAA